MSDRMFNVLVLGGMALVGCGGAVSSQGPDTTTRDAASAGNGSSPGTASGAAGTTSDAAGSAFPGDASRDGQLPSDPPDDAATSDAPVASDAAASPDGYADATIINPGCRLPCEAPPP